MAQTLDAQGNVTQGGFSTNMTPSQYSSVYANSSAPMPSINPVANVSNLTGTQPLQGSLQTPAPVSPPPTGDTQMAMTNAQLLQQSQAAANATPEAQRQSSLNDYLYKSLGMDGSVSLEGQKAQTQKQLEDAQGLSAKNALVTSLSGQINSQGYLDESSRAKILASPIGGLVSSDLAGREQEIERLSHIKRMDLTAQLFAAQGDVASANAVIEKAINYKYADQEAKLKNALQYFDINAKLLGQKGEQQKAMVQAQMKDLETKQTSDLNLSKMITEATPLAPPSVIKKAQEIKDNGGSAIAVAQALGRFGGDYQKSLLLTEQIKTEKAQQANYYQNVAKSKVEMAQTQAQTQAMTVNGVMYKPLSESEAKDLTYAQRGDQAQSTISGLENKIVNMNAYSFGAQKLLEDTTVGNAKVSDDMRQVRQAERNFATAILRRESGASISPTEFSTMEKQYFPRPGDDTTTLQQKSQNRTTAVETIKQNVPGYNNRVKTVEGSYLDTVDRAFSKVNGGTTVDSYLNQLNAK